MNPVFFNFLHRWMMFFPPLCLLTVCYYNHSLFLRPIYHLHFHHYLYSPLMDQTYSESTVLYYVYYFYSCYWNLLNFYYSICVFYFIVIIIVVSLTVAIGLFVLSLICIHRLIGYSYFSSCKTMII
eukprot:UN00903